MHLLVLLLLAVPLAAVELSPPPVLSTSATVAIAIGGQMALILVAACVARWVRRRLAAGHGWTVMRTGDRWQRRLQWASALPHAIACVWGGLLARTRLVVGDVVLVDELAVVLPPLVTIVAVWWIWAPLEAAARDWDTLMRADQGLAIVRRPGRAFLVLTHLRTQVLLVLVPALVALGLVETVRRLAGDAGPPWLADAAQMGAVLLVLAASPWIVRLVLDAVPMAPGELRRRLAEVGEAHRVRIGQILVWRTGLTMHNGAVVGFVPWVRCVLLTDALVEDLSEPELIAVMAHEVAHLRHRHTIVAALVLIGAAALLGVVLDRAGRAAADGLGLSRVWPGWEYWGELGVVVVAVSLVLAIFGWVSRRLERQADGFAARHLSETMALPDAPAVYSEGAVQTMCNALEAVAAPSGIDPARHSWRHGSIRWRQQYLRTLIGRPLVVLPVDRQVRWITALALVSLVAAIVLEA